MPIKSNLYATGGNYPIQMETQGVGGVRYYHIFSDTSISDTFSFKDPLNAKEITIWLVGAGGNGNNSSDLKSGDGGNGANITVVNPGLVNSVIITQIGTQVGATVDPKTIISIDSTTRTSDYNPVTCALGGTGQPSNDSPSDGGDGGQAPITLSLDSSGSIALGPGGGGGGGYKSGLVFSNNGNDGQPSSDGAGAKGQYTVDNNGDTINIDTQGGISNLNVPYTYAFGGGGGGGAGNGTGGFGGNGVVIISYTAPAIPPPTVFHDLKITDETGITYTPASSPTGIAYYTITKPMYISAVSTVSLGCYIIGAGGTGSDGGSPDSFIYYDGNGGCGGDILTCTLNISNNDKYSIIIGAGNDGGDSSIILDSGNLDASGVSDTISTTFSPPYSILTATGGQSGISYDGGHGAGFGPAGGTATGHPGASGSTPVNSDGTGSNGILLTNIPSLTAYYSGGGGGGGHPGGNSSESGGSGYIDMGGVGTDGHAGLTYGSGGGGGGQSNSVSYFGKPGAQGVIYLYSLTPGEGYTGGVSLTTIHDFNVPTADSSGVTYTPASGSDPFYYQITSSVIITPIENITLNYILIGGGGGGNGKFPSTHGTGGNGGQISTGSITFIKDTPYTITIGAGGQGNDGMDSGSYGAQAGSGGNSVITDSSVTYIASGGAGGGSSGQSGLGAASYMGFSTTDGIQITDIPSISSYYAGGGGAGGDSNGTGSTSGGNGGTSGGNGGGYGGATAAPSNGNTPGSGGGGGGFNGDHHGGNGAAGILFLYPQLTVEDFIISPLAFGSVEYIPASGLNPFLYSFSYYGTNPNSSILTITATQTQILNYVVVGGGGGGGYASTDVGGSGGNAGHITTGSINFISGTTYDIYVGKGGQGSDSTNGGDGSLSKIIDNDSNVTYEALGGIGGAAGVSGVTAIGGDGSYDSSGAHIGGIGGNGTQLFSSFPYIIAGGGGAGGVNTFGSHGGNSGTSGGDGGGYDTNTSQNITSFSGNTRGSGGGGGGVAEGTPFPGSNGADGQVIFYSSPLTIENFTVSSLLGITYFPVSGSNPFYYQFDFSGSDTSYAVTISPTITQTLNYIIIGGGGAGGSGSVNSSTPGSGGNGGEITTGTLEFTSGEKYILLIGNGGVTAIGGGSGNPGSDSSICHIISGDNGVGANGEVITGHGGTGGSYGLNPPVDGLGSSGIGSDGIYLTDIPTLTDYYAGGGGAGGTDGYDGNPGGNSSTSGGMGGGNSSSTVTGESGITSGSGGGGGGSGNSDTQAGNGAPGVIFLYLPPLLTLHDFTVSSFLGASYHDASGSDPFYYQFESSVTITSTNTQTLKYFIVGGGGSGGSGDPSSIFGGTGGSGGSGGQIITGQMVFTNGNSYTLSIGTGGIPPTNDPGAGNPGTDSSIVDSSGTSYIALGGAGGGYDINPAVDGSGNGVGSNGRRIIEISTSDYYGGGGGAGAISGTLGHFGGNGGTSGGDGAGATNGITTSATGGHTYGSGGGGGGGNNADGQNDVTPGAGVGGVIFLYNASSPPPPSTCFLAGTLVVTDQGEIAIEKINPRINTINGKRILAITETPGTDGCLCLIKKNHLSRNVPNKDTVISVWHKILHKGVIREAQDIQGVLPLPYEGQPLYNILMEKYELVRIHNMVVETLLPTHAVAKLYHNIMKKSIRQKTITLS